MSRRFILLIFSASFLACFLLACVKKPETNTTNTNREVDTSTLVAEIEKIVGAGKTRIHYLSAAYLKDQIGVEKALFIALANISSDDNSRTQREALAYRITEVAKGWLNSKNMLIEGTAIEVSYHRIISIWAFSASSEQGRFAYYVGADGALTKDPPAPAEP